MVIQIIEWVLFAAVHLCHIARQPGRCCRAGASAPRPLVTDVHLLSYRWANVARSHLRQGNQLGVGDSVDYYESVVIDYLRADRALFVNTECCIQLNESDNPDNSGPHWYCDAVVCDLRSECVFLVEISYSANLGGWENGLIKRLRGWNENWLGVRAALARDCSCFIRMARPPMVVRARNVRPQAPDLLEAN